MNKRNHFYFDVLFILCQLVALPFLSLGSLHLGIPNEHTEIWNKIDLDRNLINIFTTLGKWKGVMPFGIWGYNMGVQGTGLMWVKPWRNIFEFPRGIFEQINFNFLEQSRNKQGSATFRLTIFIGRHIGKVNTVVCVWEFMPGWPGSRFLLPFLSPLS